MYSVNFFQHTVINIKVNISKENPSISAYACVQRQPGFSFAHQANIRVMLVNQGGCLISQVVWRKLSNDEPSRSSNTGGSELIDNDIVYEDLL